MKDRVNAARAWLLGAQEWCTHHTKYQQVCDLLGELQEKVEYTDDALDEVLKERDLREEIIDKLLDLVLGENRPEWSNMYDFNDALTDVECKMKQLEEKEKK